MEIINYPNYIIYKDGQIFNKKKTKFIKHTILTKKDRPDTYKYLVCTLRNDKGSKHFFIHRLLVQHFKPDEWNPDLCIDHIDRNPLNNNLDNLRCVTNLENQQNKSKFKNNTSGVPNISFRKDRNKWRYKKIINKKYFEQTFDTLEEATIFKKKYELENNIFKKKIYKILYMENENYENKDKEINSEEINSKEINDIQPKKYNKKKHAEYCKTWRQTHKEHLKNYRQKEDYKEYQKNYRKKNKEKIAQQKRNWYLKQKEKKENSEDIK